MALTGGRRPAQPPDCEDPSRFRCRCRCSAWCTGSGKRSTACASRPAGPGGDDGGGGQCCVARRGATDFERPAWRGGSVGVSLLTPAGRRRVRSAGAARYRWELQWAGSKKKLASHYAGRVAAGVSTRRYADTLDPVPADVTERATSSSAVSRRFVALSTKRPRRFSAGRWANWTCGWSASRSSGTTAWWSRWGSTRRAGNTCWACAKAPPSRSV